MTPSTLVSFHEQSSYFTATSLGMMQTIHNIVDVGHRPWAPRWRATRTTTIVPAVGSTLEDTSETIAIGTHETCAAAVTTAKQQLAARRWKATRVSPGSQNWMMTADWPTYGKTYTPLDVDDLVEVAQHPGAAIRIRQAHHVTVSMITNPQGSTLRTERNHLGTGWELPAAQRALEHIERILPEKTVLNLVLRDDRWVEIEDIRAVAGGLVTDKPWGSRFLLAQQVRDQLGDPSITAGGWEHGRDHKRRAIEAALADRDSPTSPVAIDLIDLGNSTSAIHRCWLDADARAAWTAPT